MGSQKWGFLIAMVLGGVGLVLFALGFDAHTTEAMPFGAMLTGLGLIIGVPSLQALRATVRPDVPLQSVGKLLKLALLVFSVGLGLVGLGMQPRTKETLPFGLGLGVLGLVLAGVSRLRGREVEQRVELEQAGAGPVAKDPPTSVRCENCGSPAPLRLSDPTHATCAHCGTRFALAPALAAVMKAAQVLMRAQGDAERKISAVLQALPEKHLALRARLMRSSGGLAIIAAVVAVFGFLRRNDDDGWHRYVLFGLSAGIVVVVLGRWLGRLIPRVAGGIVGHWAALQVPGVEGLACRVCGASLPSVAAPVLRCEYCAADNLAGPAVQALVAQQAGHAVREVLSVTHRDSTADELAAFATASFPLLTLVAWFAVAAIAGGVGGSMVSELHLSPAPVEFAVVRVEGAGLSGVCAAARIDRGSELELRFKGDRSVRLQASELSRYAVEPNVDARWFIGHRVNGSGKVVQVYSLVRSPNRVEAKRNTGSELYFPYDGLGAETICLDDVSREGPTLDVP